MLRALRFASVYGMKIEDAAASAIHRNKDLLREIAAERVQSELTKMLCGKGCGGCFARLFRCVGGPDPGACAHVRL